MRAAAIVVVLAGCAQVQQDHPLPPPPPLAPRAAPPAPVPDLFSDLLVAPADCTRELASVSRAGVLADVAALERILRRGYAGFDILALHGLNWDRWFREIGADVAPLHESNSPVDVRVWLAKHLTGIGDHAITVSSFDNRGVRQISSARARDNAFTVDVVLDDRRDLVVAAAEPKLVGTHAGACKDGGQLDDRVEPAFVGPKATRGYRVVRYAELPPDPRTCTFKRADGTTVDATLPFRPVHLGTDAGPAFELKTRVVPVMRVRALDNETDLDQLNYASAKNFQYQAMVLDLRGVRPGDYSFVYFFQSLLGTQLRGVVTHRLDSEVIAQGEIDETVCSSTSPTESSAKELADARADLADRAKTGHADRVWFRSSVAASARVGGKLPARPYPGVFILVVDRACTGMCEEAVVLARQLPRTIVLGENTGGAGEFGEPLPYRLPNSGLWVSVPREYSEGVTAEGHGHEPDFWLDGDHLDDTIDAVATCAIDAGCARDIVHNR